MDNNHAMENAVNWYQSIVEMLGKVKNDNYDDDVYNEIRESPLSIEVQSEWHVPGENNDKPSKYMILLTTGGPALRIIGDLDNYCQPESAELEWQDWGTPWTTIWNHEETSIDEDVLLQYASYFWYGD